MAQGVVTNDPAGATHLLPVSRQARRYFYLHDYTVAREECCSLLDSSRPTAGGVCVGVHRYDASLSIL